MGNYVFDARVLIDAVTEPTRRTRTRPTTSAATSSRCWSSAAQAQVFDFASSVVPGVSGARARLLARHRDARRLLRRAHGPDLARPDLQPLQRATGRSSRQPDRQPPAKFVFEEPGHTGMAVDSMVCAGVIVSGGVVRRSVLSPGSTSARGAEVEGSVLLRRRRHRRGRDREERDRRQERRVEPGATLGVDLERRPRAVRRLARRDRRGRQGRACRYLTFAPPSSRASTRPTSTAAPACTSSTSHGSSRGSST